MFKYRFAFGNDNKLIGTVNDKAEVINGRGEKSGMVDFDGNVVIGGEKAGYALYDMYIYDNNDLVSGYITADRDRCCRWAIRTLAPDQEVFWSTKEGKAVGRGNRDFHIRDNLNAILGELRLDGRVLNAENELVGTLGSSGDIISAAGEVIARARPLQFYEAVKRQPIYDKDGNIIGYVSPRLQAVDAKGG